MKIEMNLFNSLKRAPEIVFSIIVYFLPLFLTVAVFGAEFGFLTIVFVLCVPLLFNKRAIKIQEKVERIFGFEEGSNHLLGLIYVVLIIIEVTILIGYKEYQKTERVRLTKELQPTIEMLRPKLVIPSFPEGTNMNPIMEPDPYMLKVTYQRLYRPYVFVYLGKDVGGAGASPFRNNIVLENDEGVMNKSDFEFPRKNLNITGIRTIILLQDRIVDKSRYTRYTNGLDAGTELKYRYGYDMWAFDIKTGSLGVYSRLADPQLQKEYKANYLDYSDLSKWANSVTYK